MRFFTTTSITLLAAAILPSTFAAPLTLAELDPNVLYSPIDPRQALGRAPYCRDHGGVHIIAGSGAGGQNVRGYGLLNSTINMILAKIPNSSNYSVPYNKTSDPAYAGAASAQGLQLMTSNIQWYADGCPNTPIVLLGYSEGAIITMNTLCGRSRQGSLPYGVGLNSSYAKNIIATVVYGDETRIPGQPYDLGTCLNGNGTIPRMNPAGCEAFQDNFQSYCDINDPECCTGSPDPNMNVHYTYPATYNEAATDFILSKYNARKGITTTAPTTTASTTSSQTTSITSSTPTITSTTVSTHTTATSTTTSTHKPTAKPTPPPSWPWWPWKQ